MRAARPSATLRSTKWAAALNWRGMRSGSMSGAATLYAFSPRRARAGGVNCFVFATGAYRIAARAERHLSAIVTLEGIMKTLGSRRRPITAVVLVVALAGGALAQRGAGQQAAASTTPDTPEGKYFKATNWRQIGPFRGGRVLAVGGAPAQ